MPPTQAHEPTTTERMTATNVLTPAIAATLTEWAEAFPRRWVYKPPEFFDIRYLLSYDNEYRRDIDDRVNPIYADWFPRLVREATEADLTLLETSLGADGIRKGYLRFFQYELLGAVKAAAAAGRPYAAIIPGWFRAKGWRIDLGAEESPAIAAAPPHVIAEMQMRIATLSATLFSLSATPARADLEAIIDRLRESAYYLQDNMVR